jgi:hypothetical protein
MHSTIRLISSTSAATLEAFRDAAESCFIDSPIGQVTSSGGRSLANPTKRLTQRRPTRDNQCLGCWPQAGTSFNTVYLASQAGRFTDEATGAALWQDSPLLLFPSSIHPSLSRSLHPDVRTSTMTKHYTKSFTPQEKQAAIAKYADHIKYSARYSGEQRKARKHRNNY